MSYILGSYQAYSQRKKSIMERVDPILNDYQEIYDLIASEGNAEQFSSLVNFLKQKVLENNEAQETLTRRALSLNTTGYNRVTYSGNDPLRINAADDYNRKQREREDKESEDNINASVKAEMALNKVESALVAVEKFLKDYETELAPYYQKKKEEKVLAEARAESEKREAENKINDKKKKARIISAIITLCLTVALFFIYPFLFAELGDYWVAVLIFVGVSYFSILMCIRKFQDYIKD